MVTEHSQDLNAIYNGEKEARTSPTDTAPATSGEKPCQGEVIAPKSDGMVSGVPAPKVKNFGSWDPKEFEGPFGKGQIIGPVGYYISWNSGAKDEETDRKGGEGAEAEMGDGEAAEGMETSGQ